MNEHLVGLVRVPISIDGFVAIAAAFEKAWPGCTVGITQNVEVPLDSGGRYHLTGIPIYEAKP